MKGNEAIGEAAIIAGCRNYFAYPITPQSEIAEHMAKRMPEVDGVFLQGESEVAVSYMVFGAAGCGERVMTSSSSPGISLMSEALSFISAAQCPAVFVNINRGGPGLGGVLPSQGDYFQVTKGGGHGDYRLLVLAPDGVQEAVEMTMQAFSLAEKYRNPVMILGDGLIGQMMEPVEFPENLVTHPTNKDEWATNGKSTRKSKKRNLIKSMFLDSEALHRNNLALKNKYEQMKKEDVQFEEYNTDTDYDILLVSFGTMSRVCKASIDILKEKGIEVALLRPKTLFPFPEQAILKAATKDSCKTVLTIELSMGQMVEDVERSVKGLKRVAFFGEGGGDVPSPEKVIDIITNLLYR